ncbi:MAG: flagellar hook-length control protein FliK [Sedimenticola sp.]
MRELLPEAAVRQIEAKLSSGNGLPDAAEFAALIDQIIAATARLQNSAESGLPVELEIEGDPEQLSAILSDKNGAPEKPGQADEAIGQLADGESAEGLEVASELVSFIVGLIADSRRSENPEIVAKTDRLQADADELAGTLAEGLHPAASLAGVAAAEGMVRAQPAQEAAAVARPDTVLAGSSESLLRQFQRPVQENSSQRPDLPDVADEALALKVEKELPNQRQALGAMVRELAHERGFPVFNRAMPPGVEALSTVLGDSNPGVGGVARTGLEISPGMVQRTAQAAPPPLNLPMSHKAWGEGLGNRISWMLGQNVQQASLRITPPHLGPIEIKVAVSNDQTSVMFSAQHSAVREAIESAIPRLREMFSENNMQLVNVDVGQREASGQRAMDDFLFRGDGVDGEEQMEQESAEGLEQEEANTVTRVSDGLVDDYA